MGTPLSESDRVLLTVSIVFFIQLGAELLSHGRNVADVWPLCTFS